MNRYLIVVFCVLTGCTSAVVNYNGGEVLVDKAAFAQWYADNVERIEENYPLHQLFLHEIQEQKFIVDLEYQVFENLLENLPSFPLMEEGRDFNICETEVFQFICYKHTAYKTFSGSSMPIRGPSLA